MNKLMIIGCLGNDPTMRMLPDGTAVCSFNVAVSGKGKDKITTWFRVTTWRQLAENCSRFLEKGKKVAVLGSVSLSTYTKKDGTGGASLEVNADQVEFLSPKSENSEQTDKQSGMVVVNQDDLPF
ncbi:MAG: single-stranded DNA-binding protein [Candidatus Sumerlaeales bacterium]|nr:single-stranded DNA-binding protein [Candidatus Sumerlaeales bacterium]